MTDTHLRIDIIRYWPDDGNVTAITMHSWIEALALIAMASCMVVTVRASPKGRIVVTLE